MKKILLITSLALITLIFSSCSSSVSLNSVKESDSAVVESPQSVEGNIVYFTNSGFDPKEIVLNQGESLTIINNSSDKMMIASDPHPRDNAYLPLNSVKPIYPKSSFGVIFNTVGEFGYHNEYNTSQIGKATVNAPIGAQNP